MSGYHLLAALVGLVGLFWIDHLIDSGFFPTNRADRIAKLCGWLWLLLWMGPPLVVLWIKSITS
jgi:hypothetical protein